MRSTLVSLNTVELSDFTFIYLVQREFNFQTRNHSDTIDSMKYFLLPFLSSLWEPQFDMNPVLRERKQTHANNYIVTAKLV